LHIAIVCIGKESARNNIVLYSIQKSMSEKNGFLKSEYAYDSLNRMTSKARPGESAITYAYDIASRPKSVSNNGKVIEYYYDRIGRVSDVNDPDKRLVSYEYDKRGLRTELVYPDDSYVTYEYDPMARLKKIKYNGDTVAQYRYDELSRRKLLTLGNDANAVYTYNIGDRLTKLDNKIGANHVVFDCNGYDKVGNLKTMKINGSKQRYTYDKLYRLNFADYNDGHTTNYYYNALGNRTSVNDGGTVTSYISNNLLNEYTTVGGVNYDYDLNGNLTYDGTYTYIYDCENRLTEVKQGQTTVATYQYNYLGQRVSKTVGSTTTAYCYSGDQAVAEYQNGVLARKFVYGAGIDEVTVTIIVDGQTETPYYYHYDRLGSVIALSNGAGNIVERYKYNVFGKPTIYDGEGTEIQQSAFGNSRLFTGREFDNETKNYYYRNRYYNPTIGRFLQPDPIQYTVGLNLYTYCGNNPVNYVDSMGLDWYPPQWAAGTINCIGGAYDALGGQRGEVYWGGGSRALGGLGTMTLSGCYIAGTGGSGGLVGGGAGFGWGWIQWYSGLKMIRSSLYDDNWEQYLNRPGEDALRGTGDVTTGLMLKDPLTVAQGVEGLVLSTPKLVEKLHKMHSRASEKSSSTQSQNLNTPADPVDVSI